jgi:signal recognition particle receptor subunit beta
MAFVNYNNKEITVKIVYYGPALSGKTTCLRYIYDSGEYRKKGKLITLDTDGDRTLFFDFLPIEIGKLGDYSIKMQLYTVPGQVAYNTTRKLVLQGSDGIVFVADSQVVMREQNVDSFNNLKENLKANNIAFEETPLIFQYNKRDLREILPADSLNRDLNPENKAFFPTVATTGENVLEGLHTIMKMVIIHLKNKLSIFQKDKTVMFSRDEVTDAVSKKTKTDANIKPEPILPPEEDDEPFKSDPDAGKDEIFELSSPMMDEPLKTRDYPASDLLQEPGKDDADAEEEDIFNLDYESRSGGGVDELGIPEVSLDDELGLDDDQDSKSGASDSRIKERTDILLPHPDDAGLPEPEPLETFEDEDIEEIGSQYEIKPDDDMVFETPSGEDLEGSSADQDIEVPSLETPSAVGTIDVPVNIPIDVEIPAGKDEIKVNLHLQIIIKRKK